MAVSSQTTAASEALSQAQEVAPPDALRAHVYALLATLLARPPGTAVLALLAGIEEQNPGASDMASAWQMLKLAGTQVGTAEIDDEFHELFIGVGRGELVPYGSWYLTGRMLDKPLALLRADLRALGIERQAGVHEPEDHVAALCEAMTVLISDEASPQTQQQFFAEHIEAWMARFFRDLQEARAACFYRAVGRLGEQFLKVEARYLAIPG